MPQTKVFFGENPGVQIYAKADGEGKKMMVQFTPVEPRCLHLAQDKQHCISMHQLAFGAKMSEKLLRKVEEQHRSLGNGTDCAWSFVYGSRSQIFRSISWLLTSIPKTQAEPERLFIVAGIPFYISYVVEPLLEHQFF